MVEDVYSKLEKNISTYRKTTNRSLTLAEKILAGHLEEDFLARKLDDKTNYVFLRPDRVALQDVTGQTVMLQFMQAGLKSVTLPTTVHCDHLIQARTEGKSDTKLAIFENNEVYKFLESAASKIWCWILETRCRNYSSSNFRKLCVSWWFDDWHRFSYTKCRWSWYVSNWCWWDRCS